MSDANNRKKHFIQDGGEGEYDNFLHFYAQFSLNLNFSKI